MTKIESTTDFRNSERISKRDMPEGLKRCFDTQLKRRQNAIEKRHYFQSEFVPTKRERELKQTLLAPIKELLDEKGARQLNALEIERTNKAVRAWKEGAFPGLPNLQDRDDIPPPWGDGPEMWWWQSSAHHHRQATITLTEDGATFEANFSHESGNLVHRNLLISMQYGIGSDRLEGYFGKTLESRPLVIISGEIAGMAFESGIFDFGDRWCKCWLTIRQDIDVTINAPDGKATLGYKVSHTDNIIAIEGGGFEFTKFPDLIYMPSVVFDVPPYTESVISKLEWEINVQLENSARLLLGHAEWNPLCRVVAPQWRLRTV